LIEKNIKNEENRILKKRKPKDEKNFLNNQNASRNINKGN